jgi:ADP-heptose:LPS heptosyltransferase
MLRRERFSSAVLVNRSFRAALIVRLAGIRMRVGHAMEGRGALVSCKVPYEEDKFEAETCMDLARALGFDGDIHPHLRVSEEEMRFGREALEGATIGIQPGTRYEAKQIPLSVLHEVVSTLQSRGESIVLVGGADEVEIGRALQDGLSKPVKSLIGETDIRQSLGVLANLRLVVGGDTGLMHMAAAVGGPTVTVFGPTNAKKWGHHYSPHQVVVAPGRSMKHLSFADLEAAVSQTHVM